MPQLRKDPVTERWVIIATERARRPGNFVKRDENLNDDSASDCKFCNSTETAILNGHTKVISHAGSFLSTDQKYSHKGKGLYDVVSGFGTHEVVIETSEHVANMADFSIEQIKYVLEAYKVRMIELQKNKLFQYIVAYKNYGESAGGRNIAHARSHIIATPIQPARVAEMFHGAKKYHREHGKCIYCDLIKQEKEKNERVVFETDHFIAIAPFAARFLFEITILPKEHHADFTGNIEGKEGDLALMLKTMLMKFKVGLDDPAYNYVIHTAPLRHDREGEKWKTIKDDYHWHIELMPKLTQVAGFEKGTGFYINSIPPENTAQYLKEVDIS
jgi:UDPglucose--hexose-1-phosphate uridylyltransferase